LQLDEVQLLSVDAVLDVDPAKQTFQGRVTLALDLDEPMRDVWLHARALSVSSAQLHQDGESRPVVVRRQEEDQLRLAWKGAVEGTVTIEVSYTGQINTEAPVGLFHRQGGDHDYLFTQLEPDEGRRVFPMLDQPNQKVPWTLTLRVPDGMRAYSNGALLEQRDEGDQDVYAFKQTPPLPSYLIALAVGPFEEVDAGVAGQASVPIRLLLPPERAGDASWAIEQTGPILDWMESWFGSPYPYEKLDVVAIPDLIGYAAMEHPGLITFDQRLMVATAATDTVSRRRAYVEVQAHELAHQWFGNLVTPAWWDDLWLNEGFASWMGTKAVAALHPEWNVPFDQVATRERAMSADALVSARRIREPIVESADIDMAFDSITYSKGQAVLEMFETWLTPAAFRSGVQEYLRRHANSTATTDDFLAAMADATGRPVTDTFSTFLDQPGVPLVDMTLRCEEDIHLVLSQRRYLPTDPDATGLWQLPVCVRTPASDGPLCTLMTEPVTHLPLPDKDCPQWLVPSANATGYYRSALGEEQTTALLASSVLTPTERVALVGDAAALVASGELPPSTVLAQVPELIQLGQVPVTQATISVIRQLDRNLVSAALRPAYAKFIRETYGELAASLGFDPQEGEPEETALLRPTVLRLVGLQGEDAAIRAEARARVSDALQGRGAAPEVLQTVLILAAADGDLPLFEQYQEALVSTEDDSARRRILSSMTGFSSPEVVDAVIEMVTSSALPIAERGTLMFGLFSNRLTQPTAWERMKTDLDQIEQLIPAPFRRYISLLVSPMCTPEARTEAETLLAPRAKRWLGGSKTLEQTLERIDTCVSTTEQQQPGVATFLSSLTQ
jgi:alanyl aminopeptidase